MFNVETGPPALALFNRLIVSFASLRTMSCLMFSV